MNAIIKNFLQKKSGFTLLEVTMTVIIISVISAAAISRYPTLVERQRAKSAERMLMDMRASQERYRLDTKNYASDLEHLDSAWNNFTDFTAAAFNNAANLATMERLQSSFIYTLAINSAGNIFCIGASCTKLGYGADPMGGGGGGGETPNPDPTPKDPTPTDPTPTDPSPTNPTPKDPTPTDPTPTDPTPTDPSPTNPTPTDPTPTDPTPTDPTPTEPTPKDPEPSDPNPSEDPKEEPKEGPKEENPHEEPPRESPGFPSCEKIECDDGYSFYPDLCVCIRN